MTHTLRSIFKSQYRMTKLQDSNFALPSAARQGAAHDCMDAGGRATQGAVAEGGAA